MKQLAPVRGAQGGRHRELCLLATESCPTPNPNPAPPIPRGSTQWSGNLRIYLSCMVGRVDVTFLGSLGPASIWNIISRPFCGAWEHAGKAHPIHRSQGNKSSQGCVQNRVKVLDRSSALVPPHRRLQIPGCVWVWWL